MINITLPHAPYGASGEKPVEYYINIIMGPEKKTKEGKVIGKMRTEKTRNEKIEN